MKNHGGRLMTCCKACCSCIKVCLERSLLTGLASADAWMQQCRVRVSVSNASSTVDTTCTKKLCKSFHQHTVTAAMEGSEKLSLWAICQTELVTVEIDKLPLL
jgi:hypothetical protein